MKYRLLKKYSRPWRRAYLANEVEALRMENRILRVLSFDPAAERRRLALASLKARAERIIGRP